jgi:hypothetical protein
MLGTRRRFPGIKMMFDLAATFCVDWLMSIFPFSRIFARFSKCKNSALFDRKAGLRGSGGAYVSEFDEQIR